MSFEMFKMAYLSLSIISTLFVCWNLRNRKDDLWAVFFMSVVMLALFFAQYLDAGVHDSLNDFSELVFPAITHMRRDLILMFCNVLLWGTVPFALALLLRNKRHGNVLVWGIMLMFVALKSLFEDFFVIHQFPQAMFHPFEWEYVLTAWLIIYGLAGLFIIKGIKFMTMSEN